MANSNIEMNMGGEEQEIAPDNLDIDTVYIVEIKGKRPKMVKFQRKERPMKGN